MNSTKTLVTPKNDTQGGKSTGIYSKNNVDWPASAYNTIEYDIKNLSGKILTIIDAAGMTEQQNKAIKDLVKREVSQSLGRIQGMMSNLSQKLGGCSWGSSIEL